MDLAAIIARVFGPSLWLPYRAAKHAQRERARRGAYGERVAKAYLRSQGCRVLAKNFRARGGGEVDLIARQGRELLFVEVKTRAKGAKISGLAAINHAKKRYIERGANAWLTRYRQRQLPWRFDCIEVILEPGQRPLVKWVKNVF